jgi:hypothetical protein
MTLANRGLTMQAERYPKAVRRALRELAAKAHEVELGRELGKLEAEFAHWRSGELDAFELNGRIHAFHQGPSRELYSKYQALSPDTLVCLAVCRGGFQESDLPAEVLQHLQALLELQRGFFKAHAEEIESGE